ncbi:Rrf2 family transcriptional regulator [Brucella pituitosa]|uniref:Rrf2 family transcriptional regulator n=1 Tax=Brucella pituitosa TaxID=571256 RepID=A0A643EWE9_9HYPH|nr:Rrf2 family transcriptional regulator [Brucella pituitosa]PRA84286.1 Rrf2 family transcriptional regulator [Ochrobactrum sp. MYb29]KAB0569362.1 Rrf2 family transcriptional regulator [Brucella pituitosa]MBO1041155.1 Rrf2 family transcriptional regulator [Brucella pituitosa]MCK4204915.1 Rrf2 family transcriptional regulator [Brucella pituitosa]PJO49791.1 Rrf2 family transcriptional regulator [Brucella pituitosa]
MMLKSQVEWALHCCAILSGLPEGRYLSTKALAELHGLPKEYLSKALQALSQAGLVHTTLGPSGGYRLARPASELTFLDIIEAVEGNGRTFVCQNIRANNPCRPKGYCESRPCAIARIMWEADERWRECLRAVTFSDLGNILQGEITPEIWSGTFDWVMKRAG